MKAKRTDANQTEIVEALISAGCMVQSLAMVGCGTPDILWIRGGRIGLMEIKDGEKSPSARELTPAETKWIRLAAAAGYRVDVVTCRAEALASVQSRFDRPDQACACDGHGKRKATP